MDHFTRFFVECWNSLTDSFLIKVILSGAGALGMWLIHIKHVQILGVFILLVFVDLFTKWAAIAYRMLVDEYKYNADEIAVWEKYRAIPLAFDKGLISSR